MLANILAWLLKSNGAKTAGAAASGSVISVAVLLGILDKSFDQKIEAVNQSVISYVDRRHDSVSADIKYIKEGQKETKELLRVINDRVYELNRRTKGE